MSRNILLSLLIAGLSLGGCKYMPTFDEVLSDKQKDYQKSKSLPDLEVPPDLSADAIKDTMSVPVTDQTGVARFPSYQERVESPPGEPASREAPAPRTPAPASSGGRTRIVIQDEPGKVWPKLRDFWKERGYSLERDNADLGVMETSWLENRVQLVRDKFKLFAKAGDESGTTVLLIQHVGEGMTPSGEELSWQARPRDVELEHKLAERLAQELGGQIDSAPAAYAETPEPVASGSNTPAPVATGPGEVRVVNAGEGKKYLMIPTGLGETWSKVGDAISQSKMKIYKEDESKGVYYVRYLATGAKPAKKSMLSRLAFWQADEGEQYQIFLSEVEGRTEVVVLNREGDWDKTAAADEILNQLQASMQQQPSD
jgi:outer membrane protein assembly factor BamC